MAKYKIYYSGFAFAEASDEEEAEGKLFDGDTLAAETVVTEIEEVEEFIWKI